MKTVGEYSLQGREKGDSDASRVRVQHESDFASSAVGNLDQAFLEQDSGLSNVVDKLRCDIGELRGALNAVAEEVHGSRTADAVPVCDLCASSIAEIAKEAVIELIGLEARDVCTEGDRTEAYNRSTRVESIRAAIQTELRSVRHLVRNVGSAGSETGGVRVDAQERPGETYQDHVDVLEASSMIAERCTELPSPTVSEKYLQVVENV